MSLVERIDGAAPDPTIPKRRYRLVADIGGDTLDELVHALAEISFRLGESEPPSSCTSGGSTSGWHVELVEDPEQTHDRYVAQLQAWRQTRRQTR